MSRSRALVLITGIITVTRYALIAHLAYQATLGRVDAASGVIVAVMTVTLWGLNGAGLLMIGRWMQRKFKGAGV